jgi:aryl-phospho-beta-D-glucosidase BglC (GH1 family)
VERRLGEGGEKAEKVERREEKHIEGRGLTVIISGTSWFGYETSNNVFHGLWARDYKDLLDFLATNGFNGIRVRM